MGINVAFPIIDHGDHARLRQTLLGLGGGRQPARRFLVRQRTLFMPGLDIVPARPNFAAGQPKTGTLIGIDCHHRVQDRAKDITFPDFAEAAPILWGGGKFDVAAVLDRQHVTAANRRARLLAPAFDQFIDRYPVIGEKPPKAHHLVPGAASNPAHARAARAKHATEKCRPPLSRRQSPKRPSEKSAAVCIR